VLGWFQRHWKGFDKGEAAREYVDQVLGADVYGFASLFEAIGEHHIPAPNTNRQLAAILQEHLYVEGELLAKPHAIQVLTDDDELELAYYFFDDHCLAANADKAAYLLLEGSQLPTSIWPRVERLPVLLGIESLSPGSGGAGFVYGAFLSYTDSSSLIDIKGTFRIKGLRLPGIINYLGANLPDEHWLRELVLLRALTVGADGEPTPDRGLGDILAEAGTVPLVALDADLYRFGFGEATTSTEDRDTLARATARTRARGELFVCEKSLVQSGEHVAGLCLHADRWETVPQVGTDLFTRWILFDDIWLRAHPVLGKAILRFGARWDVLT